MSEFLESPQAEACAPAAKFRVSWSEIRSALSGGEFDFTSGNLNRAIFLLALPMVLEMLMESAFAVADVFFVARLGANATATVGLTETLMLILVAIVWGMCMSTTAMVSRRIGEKDPGGAARAAVQAIGLGVATSGVVGVIGVIFHKELLALMGATPEVIDLGWGYTATMFAGNITLFLLFLLNAVFRGAGDAHLAMRVLWMANAANILLDPCLIYGLGPFPELGVTGAAVATNIGRGLGVVYQLHLLFSGKSRIRLSWSMMHLEWPVMIRLMRVSLGGIGQLIIATSSWILVVRVIAHFGSPVVAGCTIATRIFIFVLLPAWGIANAAATLVGQNLGAGKPDRAESSVWMTSRYNMAFLGIVAVVFIIWTEPLIAIFTNDPEVLVYGVSGLRFFSYGLVFHAWGMVMIQAFNGAGDTMRPTVINFFCFWLLQIPLCYLLAIPFGFGPNGAFVGVTISESILAVVGVLVFRRGKWKQKTV